MGSHAPQTTNLGVQTIYSQQRRLLYTEPLILKHIETELPIASKNPTKTVKIAHITKPRTPPSLKAVIIAGVLQKNVLR